MKYTFDDPMQALHYFEEAMQKILNIERKDFGRLEININRTTEASNYQWVIDSRTKKMWEMRFEKERR